MQRTQIYYRQTCHHHNKNINMNYIIIDKVNVTEEMEVVRICLDEINALIEADNVVGYDNETRYSETEKDDILNSLHWKPIETDGFTFTTRRELKAYHIEQANLETEGMSMPEIEATFAQAYNNLFS